MALTVASMSTMIPFRTPVDGAIPTARISIPPTSASPGRAPHEPESEGHPPLDDPRPSRACPAGAATAPASPTTVQTFVVPISNPTMISLLATNDPSLQPLSADQGKVEEDPTSQCHHGGEI